MMEDSADIERYKETFVDVCSLFLEVWTIIASPITFSKETATLIRVLVSIACHKFVTQNAMMSQPTEFNTELRTR